jgi:hypothetical protein
LEIETQSSNRVPVEECEHFCSLQCANIEDLSSRILTRQLRKIIYQFALFCP